MKHRLLSALLPICLLILATCGTTIPTEGNEESTSTPATEIITREEVSSVTEKRSYACFRLNKWMRV